MCPQKASVPTSDAALWGKTVAPASPYLAPPLSPSHLQTDDPSPISAYFVCALPPKYGRHLIRSTLHFVFSVLYFLFCALGMLLSATTAAPLALTNCNWPKQKHCPRLNNKTYYKGSEPPSFFK